MSTITNSVLELPFGSVLDPDEFIRAAMAWHFDPATGSPFWIERAKTLGFDPRTEVKTHADLALFPNVTDDLRDVEISRLIPRGYGLRPNVVGIIESGGTTGAPKSLPLLADFAKTIVDSDLQFFERLGLSHEKNWLCVVPSGPHGALEQARRSAQAWGAMTFAIDMDPRWVKKQIGAGHGKEVDAYVEHLLDQAANILRGQNIGCLMVTPPVLARMVRRDELVELIGNKIDCIMWGGASMDADTRHFYSKELFHGIKLTGGYGTTMALGSGGRQRIGAEDAEETIFDANLSPYTTFSVRDKDTKQPVAYGHRGQLIVNHVSKSFLLPNNDERDQVTRIAPPNTSQIGDSIADIAPLQEFKGEKVVEGVY